MPEKTGQRLILGSLTIENGSCGLSDGFLWCWVTGYSLPEAANIFFNSGYTQKIIYEYGEMSDEYDGYTNCIHLSIDNGQVSACLVKG